MVLRSPVVRAFGLGCLFFFILVDKIGSAVNGIERDNLQESVDSTVQSPTIPTANPNGLQNSVDKENDGFSRRHVLQRRSQSPAEGKTSCSLSEDNVSRFYRQSSRQWLVTDEVLDTIENDVQLIIECANEDDGIFFRTSTVVRPIRTLNVTKNLTLGTQYEVEFAGNGSKISTPEMTRFTCPESGQLITSQSPSLTLRDLAIEDCNTTSSLIELDTECDQQGSMGTVRLLRIFIENNAVFGEAHIIDSKPRSCLHLELDDILMRQNLCAIGSCMLLPPNNTLSNIQLFKNEGVNDSSSKSAIFSASKDSYTTAINVTSEGNQIRSFSVSNGTLIIVDSNFSGNTWNLSSLSQTRVNSIGGGVVFSNHSSISISRTIFEENYAFNGGGVFALSSNVSICDCQFVENDAGKGNGGAFYLHFSYNATVFNCSFKSNSAEHGGGIFMTYFSTASISSCNLTSNKAEVYGGAVFMQLNSTLTLLNSFLESNNAEFGGAFAMQNSNNATISNCSFDNNSARSFGGAAFLYDRIILYMLFVRLYNNSAWSGGGIFIAYFSTASISSCNLTRNKAELNGGAVFTQLNSTLTLLNSFFSSNNAENGGALFMLNFNNAKVSNCSLDNNSAHSSGGAIYMENRIILHLSFVGLHNNSAERGGGIFMIHFSSASISSCNLTSNKAEINGGAIFMQMNSSLTLLNSFLARNEAKNGGGALSMHYSINATVSNCNFDNNLAGYFGGAAVLEDRIILYLSFVRLHNNSAERGGGIFVIHFSSVSISSCDLTRNKAAADGGAIFMQLNSTLTLLNSFLSSNNAENGGALVMLNFNNAKVSNCSFDNNSARFSGGAIYMENRIMLHLSFVGLHNNSALDGGGIFVTHFSTASISSCNLTSNNAAVDGGAVLMQLNSTLTLLNSFLSSNNAENGGGALSLAESFSITVSNCMFISHRATVGGVLNVAEGARISFLSSTINNNMASNGGALYIYDSRNATVSNCSFTENAATYNGGAIYMARGSTITLIDSSLSGNEARHGGAMLLSDSSNATNMDTSFTNNKASLVGGALFLGLYSISTLYRCFLSGNNSTDFIFSLSLPKQTVCCPNGDIAGNLAVNGGSLFMEAESAALVLYSKFIENEARSNGGAIYMQDSFLSLQFVTLNFNIGLLGGAVCSWNATMNITNSTFVANFAQYAGGAIYIERSDAELKNTNVQANRAIEDCGGICAIETSRLDANSLIVLSNVAGHSGGGIGISNATSILCYSCLISNNEAYSGAGLYVSSNNSILVVAQLQNSRFENNSAQSYGGGITLIELLNGRINCSSSSVTCGHIVLLNTNFKDNYANHTGAAILTSVASGILIDCDYRGKRKRDFLSKRDFRSLEILNPRQLCSSWTGNRLSSDEYGGIVGTYAEVTVLHIAPDNEVRLVGNRKSGYVLVNVRSGNQLPTIYIKLLDGFGVGPAPTLPHVFEARLSSLDGLFRGIYPANISAGSGGFSEVVPFAQPGNYTLEIRSDNVALETLIVFVIVRKCQIGEEPTSDRLTCQDCDAISYNFNPSEVGGCTQCPNGGTCLGRYIIPKKGYWHKSPCHDTMHKCHSEEACNYDDRHEALKKVTTNFTNCNTTKAEIEAYNDKLCNKGFKGPLCGSCKKSYGLSSSFECIKCGDIILSIIMILAIICYLLFGTCISISGTLPLDSNQTSTQDEETPLLETHAPFTIEDASTSETRAQEQDNTQSTQLDNAQARDEMDAINRQLSEMWKVVLNFFQVVSTAATMDIKWTSAILNFFKKLQVLGAATVESISVPIDCIFTSKSNATKAIWRTIFSVLTPMIVIALLSFYWGVRYINLHREERLYFVKRLILTIITVTYITYFDLTQVGVRAFDCVSIHDSFNFNSKLTTRVWIVDTSIDCYKDNHGVLIGLALVILILVSIGFPFFCSLMLFMRRHELYTPRSWANETLGFLCGPFKANFIYWECITMIKKALLSIVIVFSYSLGNQIQGLLILIILVFFLYIHFICYPYKDEFHTLNYYESGSLLVCCMTYTLVQFFNVERCSEFTRIMVSLSIICIISGFLCLVAFKIISDIVKLGKAYLRSKGMTLVAFIKSYLKKLTPCMTSD